MSASSIAAHTLPSPAIIGRLRDGAGALATLRAIVRNPLESIPDTVYRDGGVVSRLFGRRLAYIAHPDLVRSVLTDSTTFTQNEVMQRALSPLLGNGVLTAQGAHWRNQRRVAAPAFRNQRVLALLPAMTAAAEASAGRMLAQPGGRVDVVDEMMRAALDVILDALLPASEHVDAVLFGRALSHYLSTTGWTMALSLLRAPSWTPYPGRAEARRAARQLRALVQTVIATDPGADGASMLSLLRTATDPETGAPFSPTELLDNLLTFIAAGHETTAITLAWTLYRLSLHPDILAAVQDEIAAVAPDGPITEERLPGLVLTRRVIKEVMRLYPAAPLVVRTPTTATRLGDIGLEAGDTVYLPIYALHRHRSAWDDPERFDPDRFLPEREAARHHYAYLPFGAGPRVCMGAGLTMIEAVVVLATILRRVRFTLTPGCQPIPIARITLRPQGGIQMTAEPR